MARSDPGLVAVCGLLLSYLVLCQLASAGEGAPVSNSSKATSPAMVFGFMGGFVKRDDMRHPAAKFVKQLREEYPGIVDARVFENRKYREAYKIIRARLDADHHGKLSDKEKNPPHILLFGTSWGGSAVVYLARRLNEDGIPVLLTVQIDSVAKIGHDDSVIPPNVHQAVNYYQTHGWVRGRRKIVAEDPVRTKILGNFLLSYDKDPVTCDNFPWYDYIVTKTHVESECDPKVWSDIEALVRRELPEAGIRSMNESAASETQITTTGLAPVSANH
jgi:hypothetical protein